jgi:hypothetical protein
MAGLELTKMFSLRRRAEQKTHIQNIAVFFHSLTDIHAVSRDCLTR